MKNDHMRVVIGLSIVVVINLLYRWLSIPPVSEWTSYTLTLTPLAEDLISKTLETDPWRVFLPMDQGGGGRYAWNPAKFLPVYYLSQILSPVQLYLALSTFMVTVFYLTSYTVTKSIRFAFTLGFIVALSTFLNYAFVYGSVARNFLFLSYIAISAAFLIYYLRAQSREKTWFAAFIASTIFVIFSGELWINLSLSILIGSAFIFVWAKRKTRPVLQKRIRNIAVYLSVTMVAYLSFRLNYANTYAAPGFESEMVFTYSSLLLALEDMAVNYLTFLHMTLSNFLPGFITFSPSYTLLGPEIILAEQHGYHAQYAHLVEASHLSSWRFIAGMLFVGYFACGWKWIKTAWESDEAQSLVPVILFLISITGFATYLLVKMRPMNLSAMLVYKTMISSTGLMVLIALLVDQSKDWAVSELVKKVFVVTVFASITLSAFTRPMSHTAGLHGVGLLSGGDPIANILERKRK